MRCEIVYDTISARMPLAYLIVYAFPLYLVFAEIVQTDQVLGRIRHVTKFGGGCKASAEVSQRR